MRATKKLFGVGLLLVTATLLGISYVDGQQQPEPSQQKKSEPQQNADDPEDSLPQEDFDDDEFDDPVFDRYVDMKFLGIAFANRDAKLLTDVALQVAEGERVLHRSRNGIKSDALIKAAIRLAVIDKDADTLKRLSKATNTPALKELNVLAELGMLTARKTRSLDPQLQFNIQEMDPHTVAVLRGFLDEIQGLEGFADKNGLAELQKAIAHEGELRDAQRAYLDKKIKEAMANMPESASADDELIAKMAHNSRQFIKSIGGQISNAAKKAGGQISGAAQKAGGQISGAAHKAGGQISGAAQKAGGQVSKAWHNGVLKHFEHKDLTGWIKSHAQPGDIVFGGNMINWSGTRYNHIAMVVNPATEQLIEADTPRVRYIGWRTFRARYDNVRLMRVNGLSQAQRSQALKEAIKLLDRPYGIHDAKLSDKKVYCSQLVWLAYQRATRVNLDYDGGPLVWPVDIFKSARTTTVAHHEQMK